MTKRRRTSGKAAQKADTGAKGAAAQGGGDPVGADAGENAGETAVATADAAGVLVGGDEPRADLITRAAARAAGLAFGLDDDAMDGGYAGEAGPRNAFLPAADFVRKNPAAPVDAIAIHLRRLGHDVPKVDSDAAGRRVRLAWQVFAFALKALDEADVLDAAEATGQALAQRGRPQAVPRSMLADPPPDHDPRTDIARAHARKR